MRAAESAGSEGLRPPALPGAAYALLALAWLGVALFVYRPAFDGPFVSDDNHYVANNAFIQELSAENVVAILDPTGPATIAVVNYTPVHLLLHAASWQLFGAQTTGHHVVNVLFHALASLLLVPLFLRSGIPRAGAVAGSALFLLHPANVEAVAWISQLKTSSAMAFLLAALLALPRRPAAGSALFLLALFAKPQAVVGLPVAFLFARAEGGEAGGRTSPRTSMKWLGVWTLLCVATAVAQFAAHQRSGAARDSLYDAPLSLVTTVVALPLRYLAMAASSFGISTFHELDPVTSLLDPWWLGSLAVLGLLAWRCVVAWRRRDAELAWWAFAAISYGPVSPLFPFLYQFADRYLYFMLPGLLGGALLLGKEALARLPEERHRAASLACTALAVALAAGFAVRSVERARVWASPARILADAALNYPNGVSANLGRARSAGRIGDAAGVVVALRAATDRGYNRFDQLLAEPDFAPVRQDPRFRALIDEIAAGWIESLGARANPSQGELRMIARAHIARREYREAEAALQRALQQGGALDDQLREDLTALATRY